MLQLLLERRETIKQTSRLNDSLAREMSRTREVSEAALEARMRLEEAERQLARAEKERCVCAGVALLRGWLVFVFSAS